MRAFLWGRKMPLPNILEFIGTNITQRKFQEAQEKLLNYLGIEVPTKTELNSAISNVNDAITPKADKIYVDNALAGFTNGASKFYSTLAAANADIANIGIKDKVEVGEVANGGTWYKATAEATSLTKSPYDPLVQGRAYTDSYGAAVDVSKLSNNYSLDLSSAIALVPASLRKAGTIIRFNGSQMFQFKGAYTAARFDDIRFWFNLAGVKKPNAKNIISNGVIHHGFVIQNNTTVYYHPSNKVLIGELDRDYSGNIRLPKTAETLGISSTVWLDADFAVVGVNNGYNLVVPPTAARYFALNLSYFNGTTLISNEEIFKTAYILRNGEEVNTLLAINKGANIQSNTAGLIQYTNSRGESFLKPEQDIFINPTTLTNLNTSRGIYVYLAELIKSVDVFFGRGGSKNKQTGKVRRAFISYLGLNFTGQTTIRLSVEDHIVAGQFKEYSLPSIRYENTNLADSSFVYCSNPANLDVNITIGVRIDRFKELAATEANTYTVEQTEIKPAYIQERYATAYKPQTCKINHFEMFEVSLSTNYTYVAPESKIGSKIIDNGLKNYKLVGDLGKRHQQCALSSELQTATLEGVKTLNIFANVEVDSNYTLPELTTFQVSSGTQDLLGDQYSQYIHPDITYSSSPVGGFNYHMINSIYPYSNPNYEDAEIFVSQNGLDWERVPSANEVYTGPLTIKLPPSYWDVGDDRKNLFMPIPRVNAVMQFATDVADENNTVTRILNHDPFCLYLNGYIYYYCIYNLGFTGSTTTNHRYTFCFRTNDYVNWEVVREDGTWYPYNQANAASMFSKTNGVRNHMRYRNSVSANEAAPQVVRVSDNEYYYYIVDLSDTIHRYRGTSPTQFDFSTKETITFSGAKIDRVWHCAVEYVDGKFYLIYGGRLCESTDGVTFTVPFAPFFWVGMSSDLYKPSFTIGESGKFKLAYSLQPRISYEQSFGSTNSLTVATMPTTVCCEFPSLAHVKTMGESFRKDAFIDLALSLSNEKTGRNKVYRFFGIKNTKKIKNLFEMDVGDLVTATVYLNTRSNGIANFKGIVLDNRA
jgi:hypothetical protein